MLPILLVAIMTTAAACSPGGPRGNPSFPPAPADLLTAPPTVLPDGEALYPHAVECSNVPLPPEEPFPYDYWGHAELPDSTVQGAVSTYCTMTPEEREAFYDRQTASALEISDALEDYIRRWLKGEVSARLPRGMLPPSMDSEKVHDWTLLHPEEVDPRDQWYMVPARDNPTDFSRSVLVRAYTETHVTYLRTVFVAPFGSDLVVDGDFPHARFMDFQIQQPFDPRHPVTHNLGQNEVPLVDVDIDPDLGHTNPFRTGADRNAALRHYHVTFDLEMGNASDLNPQAMQAPEFRAPGNRRTGGPMAASGPTGQGVPIPSILWLRYWSLCDAGHGPEGRHRGVIYGCIMDDEIAVDQNRDYVILLSRPEDRPSNARPGCGVTWQDRGSSEPQEILIRWLSVYPDHASNPFVPTDELVPWSTGSWSEDGYDPTLIGKNSPGVMGAYHPVLHYMTTQEFEALGCPVDPGTVPTWR